MTHINVTDLSATAAEPEEHATASVFLFRREAGEWQLGLIRHPIWGKLMTPGGHVEDSESPHEAALREVREEAGVRAELLLPFPPSDYKPERHVAAPWWVIQYEITRDNHLDQQHIHLDYVYVAVAEATLSEPELPLSWYGEHELPLEDMLPYSTSLAIVLFQYDAGYGTVSPWATYEMSKETDT